MRGKRVSLVCVTAGDFGLRIPGFYAAAARFAAHRFF